MNCDLVKKDKAKKQAQKIKGMPRFKNMDEYLYMTGEDIDIQNNLDMDNLEFDKQVFPSNHIDDIQREERLKQTDKVQSGPAFDSADYNSNIQKEID